MTQLSGRLHHGIAPLRTAIGWIYGIYSAGNKRHQVFEHVQWNERTIMLLVSSSWPWSTILAHRSAPLTPMNRLGMFVTHITKPTGKTAPPSILTRPGLEALIPADPAWIISERRPPNESITPARNYRNQYQSHYPTDVVSTPGIGETENSPLWRRFYQTLSCALLRPLRSCSQLLGLASGCLVAQPSQLISGFRELSLRTKS